MEVLEEEAAHPHLGRSVLLARMSGQATGTATSATAVPTTLLAVQAASSVAPQRMILLVVGDMRVTCLKLEALGLAAAAPAAPTGNLVTGFAPGEFNLNHFFFSTHLISNVIYFS